MPSTVSSSKSFRYNSWWGHCCHSRTRLWPPQCLSAPKPWSLQPPLQPGCLLCLDPSRHTYSVKSCVLRFFSSFAHSAPKQNWYGYKLKDLVPRSKHLCWAWWLLVLIRTCYGPQQRCFSLAHLCQHLFSMKGRTSSSTTEKTQKLLVSFCVKIFQT